MELTALLSQLGNAWQSYYDWIVIAGFFVVLPVLAATFPVLDTVVKEQLPFVAVCKAKEFWILWFVYAVLAFVVVAALQAKHSLDYGVYGFIGVFLGFPMLLQSKLFSLRDPKNGTETSVGFEYLLGIANQLLVPGMKDSIDELMASLQEDWLKLEPAALGVVVKNYLTSRATESERDKVPTWVDELIKDAQDQPAFRDKNLRTLFLEVRKAGGPRGVAYVLKRSTPRKEKP